MDLENLQLILETINATTGDAKQVAMLWLGIQALETLGWISLLGGAIFGVYRLIRKCYIDEGFESYVKSLREIVMPEESGVVIQRECRAITEAVKRGMAKKD